MDKMLELYKAVAVRETGFWIDLPAPTGQVVSRDEWIGRMQEDPEHFQLAALTDDEANRQSNGHVSIVEYAVFVIWSDERLQ